jgi:choline dehydrogenase-like flavoprotein
VLVLARDKEEGHVTYDSAGEPVVHYRVSAYDRRHLLHGLSRGNALHLAAGAHRVISLQNRPTDLRRQEKEPISEQHLLAFEREIRRRGLGPNRIVMFSAHQMGTCRMGKDPASSVVDAHQQVHGVEGLFVCDSSVFPNAPGVNPMLTIMGLAHQASQYIKQVI